MTSIGGKDWTALLEDKALTLQVGEENKDTTHKLYIFGRMAFLKTLFSTHILRKLVKTSFL